VFDRRYTDVYNLILNKSKIRSLKVWMDKGMDTPIYVKGDIKNMVDTGASTEILYKLFQHCYRFEKWHI
jgi:hypothetical protein